MPASASAAMTTLAMLRTSHWVVVTEVTFMGGCSIWTAMKIRPAVAAQMPAARVRRVVVMVMAGLLGFGSPGRSGAVWTVRTDVVGSHITK